VFWLNDVLVSTATQQGGSYQILIVCGLLYGNKADSDSTASKGRMTKYETCGRKRRWQTLNKVRTDFSAYTAAFIPAKIQAGRISVPRLARETAVLQWFYKGKVWIRRTCWLTLLGSVKVIQGDQKVNLHLMITIQNSYSNIKSVPRQSPDIYWY
jgi:hypothetical protein